MPQYRKNAVNPPPCCTVTPQAKLAPLRGGEVTTNPLNDNREKSIPDTLTNQEDSDDFQLKKRGDRSSSFAKALSDNFIVLAVFIGFPIISGCDHSEVMVSATVGLSFWLVESLSAGIADQRLYRGISNIGAIIPLVVMVFADPELTRYIFILCTINVVAAALNRYFEIIDPAPAANVSASIPLATGCRGGSDGKVDPPMSSAKSSRLEMMVAIPIAFTIGLGIASVCGSLAPIVWLALELYPGAAFLATRFHGSGDSKENPLVENEEQEEGDPGVNLVKVILRDCAIGVALWSAIIFGYQVSPAVGLASLCVTLWLVWTMYTKMDAQDPGDSAADMSASISLATRHRGGSDGMGHPAAKETLQGEHPVSPPIDKPPDKPTSAPAFIFPGRPQSPTAREINTVMFGLSLVVIFLNALWGSVIALNMCFFGVLAMLIDVCNISPLACLVIAVLVLLGLGSKTQDTGGDNVIPADQS